MRLLVSTTILLTLTRWLCLTVSPFPVPEVGNIIACFDIECLQKTVADILSIFKEEEVLFVGIPSTDFGTDSYLSLYLGQMVDLFDKMPIFKDVFFILVQLEAGIVAASAGLISILPMQSVFVCYEHGASAFSISNVGLLKNLTGIGPTVIFHLNHEKPWDFKDTNSMDYTFESLDALISSYTMHPFVIRNYFYKPLVKSSFYLPVGPTYYGYVIANRSSALYNSHLKPSSQRGIYCYFKGRTNYSFRRGMN